MDYGFLSDMIGLELRKAQIKAARKFEREFGKSLLPGHYTVLLLIKHNPGATQSAIANSAGLDRSSLVPLLKQFEKDGLITRKKAALDARTNITEITPVGERFIKQHQAAILKLEQNVIDQLGTENYKQLVQQLQNLQRVLEH